MPSGARVVWPDATPTLGGVARGADPRRGAAASWTAMRDDDTPDPARRAGALLPN